MKRAINLEITLFTGVCPQQKPVEQYDFGEVPPDNLLTTLTTSKQVA